MVKLKVSVVTVTKLLPSSLGIGMGQEIEYVIQRMDNILNWLKHPL